MTRSTRRGRPRVSGNGCAWRARTRVRGGAPPRVWGSQPLRRWYGVAAPAGGRGVATTLTTLAGSRRPRRCVRAADIPAAATGVARGGYAGGVWRLCPFVHGTRRRRFPGDRRGGAAATVTAGWATRCCAETKGPEHPACGKPRGQSPWAGGGAEKGLSPPVAVAAISSRCLGWGDAGGGPACLARCRASGRAVAVAGVVRLDRPRPVAGGGPRGGLGATRAWCRVFSPGCLAHA